MVSARALAEGQRPDVFGMPNGPHVPALSFFFPAHNEAENIEPFVLEALAALPDLADEFEIIAVDDGSKDGTAEIADRLAAEHAQVRVVHHAVNRGYGGALRSGFAASRFALVSFLDGDRQFRVADLGHLIARMAEGDDPDVVVGYRLKRADPPIRVLYARSYRLALRIFYGLKVKDPDCACKLFKRASLEGIRLESQGGFLSGELLVKLLQRGRTIAEVGVPHYPRTAGTQSGANPKVVLRAIRDFWRLRLLLSFRRKSALERGEPVLGD